MPSLPPVSPVAGIPVPDPVGLGVGDGVGVGVGVGVGDGVGVGVGAAQKPLIIVLESSVTAPLRARSCPCIVAPVVAVMEVKAKICPMKLLFVPKVAELPTCQKTRQY